METREVLIQDLCGLLNDTMEDNAIQCQIRLQTGLNEELDIREIEIDKEDGYIKFWIYGMTEPMDIDTFDEKELKAIIENVKEMLK